MAAMYANPRANFEQMVHLSRDGARQLQEVGGQAVQGQGQAQQQTEEKR